jgi:hypothetical protein
MAASSDPNEFGTASLELTEEQIALLHPFGKVLVTETGQRLL